MATLKMLSPWMNYYNELKAFFSQDDDVSVIFDEDKMNIKILVQVANKAEALSKLLIPEKTFGDTKITVTVVPANGQNARTQVQFADLCDKEEYAQIYDYALAYNRLFYMTKQISGLLGFDVTYVVFCKKVLQYYTDDLGDLNGMKSTLAENVARDIFVSHPGVFFCTDINDLNVHMRGVQRNCTRYPYGSEPSNYCENE